MVNVEAKQRTNIRTRKPLKNKLKQMAESHSDLRKLFQRRK